MTRTRTRRDGVAAVPALVCLVLASTLCAALLRQSVIRRQAARQQEWRMQAEWLVESGLARASARLAADRGYRGETWAIPAEALGGTEAGVVRIDVRPADAPTRLLVRVEADYPRDGGGDRRARHSKSLTFELRPEESGGTP
jgi:hypothetical protein